jgi:predicted  nucleic acid-binding Zn-ribbon protein
MSFLDKTDANATIAPLYEEIDDLHAQVKQYQALLASANDEVDDKLRKLNRAGLGAVDLSREVELGRERIKALEEQLAKGVGSDGQIIIRELKSVKEQLIDERTELLRKLEDIDAVSSLNIGPASVLGLQFSPAALSAYLIAA